jgi:hypothetical protein
VKSVLLQKLDLHQDPSAASKIKKQSQSLIALAFAFSLAEFPKGALTQNTKFCKYGQGNPDTPTAPKGAAVNRKVSQWQFTTVQSNQFRGQMVARLWRVQHTEQAKNWSVTHTEKRRTTPEKLASNTSKFLPQLGQVLTC